VELKRILKYFIFPVAFCISLVIPLLSVASVSNTKHNLSVSGPGNIKAVQETQICIFCHTPHNASPVYPLWNHELSAVVNYTNYWSHTLKSYASEEEAPPIDGFSKLCLSCHDGTVAIGSINAGRKLETEGSIRMITIPNVVEAGKLMPGAKGYIGTDLSRHPRQHPLGHPISIVFDPSLMIRRNAEEDLMKLRWPINDKDVKLYPTQGGYGVQCTSCHDPHGGKGGPDAPPFWLKTTHDEVCIVCHEP